MKRSLIAIAISLCFSQVHAQETAQTAALKQGGVTAAWARGITGSGAVIGVIDQGFDISHRDFLGSIIGAKNFYTNRIVTSGTHGTAMASVAAGKINGVGTQGVAPGASLLLAQTGAGGTSTAMAENSIYRALDWLSANRATVINMSFGAAYETAFTRSIKTNAQGIYLSSPSYGVNYGANSSVINYYKTATDRGSILVAAAGNQALPYSEFPGMYATRTNPNGSLVLGGRMIVVGAVDSGNRIASFSNRAGHICQNLAGSVCRDSYLTRDFFVVAPGVNITAAAGGSTGSQQISGTSPAAAYVSGGIALLKQRWPQLRPEQLVNLVLTTTKDLGARGTDDIYGRGLVDFDQATKPRGQLTLASASKPLTGTGFTGIPLTGSMAMLPPGVAARLRSTAVVQQAQVIDAIGRNYSADLAPVIMGQRWLNYAPDSPWLGLAGYQQAGLTVDSQSWITVMSAPTGTAVEYRTRSGKVTPMLQLGSMTETSGFLGASGLGAMSLGSSNTAWMLTGIDYAVSDSTVVFAQYGQGTTLVNNNPVSMFTIDPKIQSQSWRLGLKYHSFTASLGTPVSIKSGHMQASGVTGYSYNDLEDGSTVAVPIVETQRINLKLPVQEYNIALSYRQKLADTAWINYNLVHRTNAGGVSGAQTAFAGFQLTWIQ